MTGSRPSWASLGFDLVSLRVFIATIEEKSLTAAALREGIAVSAVSRRISELEGRSGIALLDRHERGVVPTRAGARLAEQLYSVFGLLDTIAADIEDIRGGGAGHIRIAAHMTALSSGLVQSVAEFLENNSSIEIEIEECTSAEARHAVETGMADLGLISGTVPPQSLCVLPWKEDELVVLLPRGHALTAKPTLSFRDILPVPFIGMQRDSALHQLYCHQAKAIGSSLHERAHATSFDSVSRMVASGLGVAILPRSAATLHEKCGNVVIRELNEQWAHRSLMLCMRSIDSISPAARKFVHHLTGEQCRKPPCPNDNRQSLMFHDT